VASKVVQVVLLNKVATNSRVTSSNSNLVATDTTISNSREATVNNPVVNLARPELTSTLRKSI
jgi:hypothetical protein